MLGKIGFTVTRFNKDKMIRQYKIRLWTFLSLCVVLIALLPFTTFFNYAINLMPNIRYANKENLTIHTVDVGQGLCVMLNLPDGTNIIMDTGTTANWGAVDKYISNILLRNGGRVDYLILSHIDSDHAGNAYNILTKYQPTNVYIPKMDTINDSSRLEYYHEYSKFYNKLLSFNVNINYNFAGNILSLGKTNFTWLAPNREYYSSTNNYSAVIMVEYNNFSMLFTGDIGHNTNTTDGVNTEAEVMAFCDIENISLDVDLLFVGHHGSKYSTSLEWLNYVKPEIAIISYGADNTYGHPSDELYENIFEYDKINNKSLSQNIYTTAYQGNVILSYDGDNYRINSIDNIHNYIFVSFAIIDVIILAPMLYMFVDSLIIYIKLNNVDSKKKDELSKK